MLTLIMGGPGTGKSYELYDLIMESISNKETCYLLVPDQYSFVSEHDIEVLLPPESSLYFHMVDFDRISERIVKKAGKNQNPTANEGTKRLMMWKALCGIEGSLISKEIIEPNYIEKMLSSVEEMHGAGISKEALEEGLGKLDPDSRFYKKLSDLHTISTAYYGMMKNHFSEDFELIDRAKTILKTTPTFFQNQSIYLDGFTGFTEQQYSLLSILIRQCNVVITLPLSENHSKQMCFAEMLYTRDRLKRYAEKAKVDYHEKFHKENKRVKEGYLNFLADNMWPKNRKEIPIYSPTKEEKDKKANVRHITAEDSYEGAEWMVADIYRKMMDEGARLRDIAIVCHDINEYRGIFSHVFSRENLYYHFSQRVPISSFEISKLLEYAFSAVAGGFQISDVVGFMKCPLSQIDSFRTDRFQLYIETWNISGEKRYAQEKPWNMNPRGYGHRKDKEVQSEIDDINETRQKYLKPLISFAKKCEECHTVIDYTKATLSLMHDLKIKEQLAIRANTYLKSGRVDEFRLAQKLPDFLLTIFRDFCDVAGEDKIKADTYLMLLKMLFSSYDIGTIAERQDAMIIGDSDLLRIGEIKYVYLFGLNEGEFPAQIKEDSCFSEDERKQLEKLDFELHPDLERRSSRELYGFVRALGSAMKDVTMIHCKKNASFVAQAESNAFLLSSQMSGGVSPIVDIRRDKPEDLIFTKESAIHFYPSFRGTPLGDFLLEMVPECKKYDDIENFSFENPGADVSSEMVKEAMRSGNHIKLTSSLIDSYLSCPFKFFASNILNIEEPRKAAVDFRNMGEFIHKALQDFVAALNKSGISLHDMSREDVADFMDKVSLECAKMYMEDEDEKPYLRHRLEGLRRTARFFAEELRREFHHSEFTFLDSEVSIYDAKSTDHNLEALKIDDPEGNIFAVTGKVDRIDGYRKNHNYYFRVIDYKTGSKSFTIQSLMKGKNLQLLIYLFTVCDDVNKPYAGAKGVFADETIKPAGAFYMPTPLQDQIMDQVRNESDTIDACMETNSLSGILLKDPDVRLAMDDGTSAIGKGLDKLKAANILDEQGMADMKQQVVDKIREIGQEMVSGHYPTTPESEKNCKSCYLFPMCRKKIQN